MRIKIRLYRLHDRGLYTMYQSIGPKKFAENCRKALRKHFLGKPFLPTQFVTTIDKGKDVIAVNITLNDTRDGQIIMELSKLSANDIPSFIKDIIRIYLFESFCSIYGVNSIIYKPNNIPIPDTIVQQNTIKKNDTKTVQKLPSKKNIERSNPTSQEITHAPDITQKSPDEISQSKTMGISNAAILDNLNTLSSMFSGLHS